MNPSLIGVSELKRVTANVIGEGIIGHDDFETRYAGCDCPPGGCVSSPTCSCIELSGGERHYDDNGRLMESLRESKPIFECSSNCLCYDETEEDGKGLSCFNRVVQRGDNPKLELFRHHLPGVGRGVRARQRIERGEFVAEYLGEVISSEVAGARLAPCADIFTHYYLFTVCEYFNGTAQRTYIDARNFGGIARFINHSCMPNLLPQIVRVGAPTPRLALFTARVIELGEEVAYNYGFSDDQTMVEQNEKNERDASVVRRKLCQCGATTCRGVLPSFAGDNL